VRLEHVEGTSSDEREVSIDRRGAQWDARWSTLETMTREWIDS